LYNPKVILNPRQMLIYPWMISPSGHSLVPEIESASVFAVHVVSTLHSLGVKPQDYADMWTEKIPDIMVQIDDVQQLAVKHDLTSDSDYMFENFGSIMSPLKSNVFSVDGYVTPLKVNVGYIYKKDPGELLDKSNGMDGSYLGFLGTKLWHLFDHERGSRDDGQALLSISEDDVEWASKLGFVDESSYIVIDGVKYFLADIALQSLYGTLSSFGDRAPVSLYKMLYEHLGEYQTWKDMILFLRRTESVRVLARDYGFGPNDALIEELIEVST
jgi:hypothetical protein